MPFRARCRRRLPPRLQFPLTALREIKILKLLKHPNVLSLREVVHTARTLRARAREHVGGGKAGAAGAGCPRSSSSVVPPSARARSHGL